MNDGTFAPGDIGDVRQLVNGVWVDGAKGEELRDKFHDVVVGRVHCADEGQIDQAVGALVRSQESSGLGPRDRLRILAEASRLVTESAETLVAGMITEAGFTRADASAEVRRAAETLRLCGEEAIRLTGEVVPLEGGPGGEGRIGFTIRMPVGVVCAITPFNSPLNTVAHKIGPALAAGNAVVLKPSLLTPYTANVLVEILLRAGLPPNLIAVVHGPGGQLGPWLTADPRVAFYTFTGSTAVGKAIQAAAGLRRTQLELGSLSSTVICQDADLEVAVRKIVPAAYRKAGQVCTSVQRLYAHQDVIEEVRDRLVGEVTALVAGDPADPRTTVGPLISAAEARRVESWTQEAAAAGGRVLAGGERRGSVVEPTLLSDVEPAMRVMAEEVFGPVLCVRPYAELDFAIDEVNATPYGLSTGIFTRDIDRALTAATRLRMGSVHINETSSSRVDLMPYGGVKESGFGKEGPHYAVREMTEERLVTLTRR